MLGQRWIACGRIAALLLVVASAFFNTSATALAIINGNTVTLQEQEDKGLITLANSCSAVLLANDWLLTAGHCIANNRDPFSVTAAANWETPGNQTRQSDAVYQFGSVDDPRRTLDLAIVHLAAPFTVHGATTGFLNQLNLNAADSLNNQTLAEYGTGFSGYPSMGDGIWRAADLSNPSVGGETFSVTPNGAGQIAMLGDSGGPYFIFQGGIPLITGIQSSATWNCSNNSTKAACKASITKITSATAVSIPATQVGVRAVLASQWHPTAISEPVWVLAGEIQATRWGFADVNTVNWAQAARSAAAMCYNRGFAGGHFDGHQDLGAGGYGIQCSGKGVFWTDVTTDQIASTGWGFTDVNTVSWTRANRAAERLCAGFNQGFAGGQFNGHMVDGRYGLFCYRDGARWFDATTEEIAATGWGWASGDIDTEPWAQGARAATGFCRGKGFSGGFMNGQVDRAAGLYGVVCQGNSMSGGTSSALPALELNYTAGLPGSFFTLRGSNFPPNSTDTIRVNGQAIAPVQIDAGGSFGLTIYTGSDDAGQYIFESTVNASSRVELSLNEMASLHPRETGGVACNLQGNCTLNPPDPGPDPDPTPAPTSFVYLPLLAK